MSEREEGAPTMAQGGDLTDEINLCLESIQGASMEVYKFEDKEGDTRIDREITLEDRHNASISFQDLGGFMDLLPGNASIRSYVRDYDTSGMSIEWSQWVYA